MIQYQSKRFWESGGTLSCITMAAEARQQGTLPTQVARLASHSPKKSSVLAWSHSITVAGRLCSIESCSCHTSAHVKTGFDCRSFLPRCFFVGGLTCFTSCMDRMCVNRAFGTCIMCSSPIQEWGAKKCSSPVQNSVSQTADPKTTRLDLVHIMPRCEYSSASTMYGGQNLLSPVPRTLALPLSHTSSPSCSIRLASGISPFNRPCGRGWRRAHSLA